MMRRLFILVGVVPLLMYAEAPPPAEIQEYEIRPVYETNYQFRYRRDPKKPGTPFFAIDTVARFLSWTLRVDISRIIGPEWIYGTRYAVYFRTRNVTNRITPVLTKLLTDQFHVVYRRGTLPAEILVLTTPYGEPKLTPSKSAKCTGGPSGGQPSTVDTGIRDPGPDLKPYPPMDLPYPQGRVVSYRGCPVSAVIPTLERQLGHLIIDETTSQGRYDFDVPLTLPLPSVRHAKDRIAEELQKKLGVEFKLAVRPVENALVIDSATPLTTPVSFR